MKYLIPILFLAACSTTPDKNSEKALDISDADFKKERPLTSAEISDFYQGNTQSLSPALQDETLDRYLDSELSTISTTGDPLLEISVLCMKKNYNQAFQVASRIFDRYQKVAPYWNLVANCHLNSGSHRKALLFYNKALEVKGDYVPALNNIGVMYARLGEDQKALVAFDRANSKGKFSKTPRYNLAKLYLTYGLSESALPIFESLLGESPQDIGLLNAVASSYFLMSDYQKSLNYYKRIPQSEWSKAEIGLNLAWTLHIAGKAQEAKQVFNQVTKPSSASLKQYYSVVADQLGAR